MSLAIPSARDMRDLQQNPGLSDVLLRLRTSQAIFTAALAAVPGQPLTTTAAITKSNTTAAVEELYVELGQAGYTVNNGTTTFTITWGN